MHILREIPELRAWTGRGIHPRVFVPTMGALHEGHLSLIDRARAEAGARGEVILSIFVNPTQFAPTEDLSTYPRPWEDDWEKCRSRGVDAVFVPPVEVMYRPDASVRIVEDQLSRGLCGASRPGHFAGVCTVVAKLFNLIQPDAAVFGQKDFQQLAIIRRLVRDLDFPVTILASPTIREPDGLAMSSRNAYLNPEERAGAVVLSQALGAARKALDEGERDPHQISQIVGAVLRESPLGKTDYLAVMHPDTLEPWVGTIHPAEGVLVALAVFFGKTRLIDNLHWTGPSTT